MVRCGATTPPVGSGTSRVGVLLLLGSAWMLAQMKTAMAEPRSLFVRGPLEKEYVGEVAQFGNPLDERVYANLMLPPDNPWLCEYPESLRNITADELETEPHFQFNQDVALFISINQCSPETKARVLAEMQQRISPRIRILIIYSTNPSQFRFVSLPSDDGDDPEELKDVGLLYIPHQYASGIDLRMRMQFRGDDPTLGFPSSEYWNFPIEITEYSTDSRSRSDGESGYGGDIYWFRIILFSLLIASPCCRACYLWYAGGGRLHWRRDENNRIIGIQYIPPMPLWLSTRGNGHDTPRQTSVLTEEQFDNLPTITYNGQVNKDESTKDADEEDEGEETRSCRNSDDDDEEHTGGEIPDASYTTNKETSDYQKVVPESTHAVKATDEMDHELGVRTESENPVDENTAEIMSGRTGLKTAPRESEHVVPTTVASNGTAALPCVDDVGAAKLGTSDALSPCDMLARESANVERVQENCASDVVTEQQKANQSTVADKVSSNILDNDDAKEERRMDMAVSAQEWGAEEVSCENEAITSLRDDGSTHNDFAGLPGCKDTNIQIEGLAVEQNQQNSSLVDASEAGARDVESGILNENESARDTPFAPSGDILKDASDRFLQNMEEGQNVGQAEADEVASNDAGNMEAPEEQDENYTPSTSCAICIDEFEAGERLTLLPRCRHAFHRECIHAWLIERQGCCPLCKTSVLLPEGQTESEQDNVDRQRDDGALSQQNLTDSEEEALPESPRRDSYDRQVLHAFSF